MYVFGSGWCGWRGGEWMRELGLGFTNPVGTGGVLDMCLCFACGGEWVGGLDQGWEWWGGVFVCVRCESGFCGPHAQKNGKSGPHCLGREGSPQFAQQIGSAVTAPLLVGCVVWSLRHYLTYMF